LDEPSFSILEYFFFVHFFQCVGDESSAWSHRSFHLYKDVLYSVSCIRRWLWRKWSYVFHRQGSEALVAWGHCYANSEEGLYTGFNLTLNWTYLKELGKRILFLKVTFVVVRIFFYSYSFSGLCWNSRGRRKRNKKNRVIKIKDMWKTSLLFILKVRGRSSGACRGRTAEIA